jgi:predicted TIM-barrel fold metal-dependent hydrolase
MTELAMSEGAEMTSRSAEVGAGRAQDARKYWRKEGFSPGGVIREVDYRQESTGLHPLFQGIKIVDTDTHFTEPADLWTSRAPARLRDRVPYVVQVDGIDQWRLGDRDFGMTGGSVISKDNHKLLGRLAFSKLDDSHRGAYEIKPRLAAMDAMGVHAQICYQNSGVTQAGSLIALRDDDLAFALLEMFNDAAAERQVESGQRLFSMAQLPIWNKDALNREARRCVESLNLKGFALPDRPEQWGVPDYSSDYWAEFFELCSDSGTPLNFHLASGLDGLSLTWGTFSFEKRLSVGAMMFSLGNAATMGNFMVSGVLDRYPKLKMCMVESGIGWVPFVLEALEHQFKEMLPNSGLQRKPREYFKDQFWVTYWFEESGPRHLAEIGVDKVMFETDFPHPTSLYPGVQAHLVKTLGEYDYDTRKRVLERNAAELYGLPF